jgi:hypothetical protein
VDDADAAQHRHRRRHAGFSHGVDGGADEGDVKGDAAGETGGKTGLVRQEIGLPRDEGDVIEREALVRELVHESGDLRIDVHDDLPIVSLSRDYIAYSERLGNAQAKKTWAREKYSAGD